MYAQTLSELSDNELNQRLNAVLKKIQFFKTLGISAQRDSLSEISAQLRIYEKELNLLKQALTIKGEAEGKEVNGVKVPSPVQKNIWNKLRKVPRKRLPKHRRRNKQI